MRTLLAVGFARMLGAVARYGIEGFVTDRLGSAFPWGTLVVNVTGSLLSGSCSPS